MGKLLLVVWGSLHGHIIANDSTQICWYANMTDAIFVPNSGKHKFGGDRYAVHENGKADIVSIRRDAVLEELKVGQWQPYDDTVVEIDYRKALRNIVDYLDRKGLSRLVTATQIIIAPGYTFKIVRGMITNFHQPQSTLLLLVSAFVDGRWREIYDYALSHDFRFLSYGDSSLLLPD